MLGKYLVLLIIISSLYLKKLERMDNSPQRTIKELGNLIGDYLIFSKKIENYGYIYLRTNDFWGQICHFSNQEVWEYFDFICF
jgi:hypothetical protein